MPVRTCIGCRKTDEQSKLIRLVLDENGRIKIDKKHRLDGRGAYVHVQRSCVDEAVRTGGLPRSFRRKTQPVDASRLWLALTEEEVTEP